MDDFQKLRDAVCQFVKVVLKDDQGISEDAYGALCEMAEEVGIEIKHDIGLVNATDGRYYLTDEEEG